MNDPKDLDLEFEANAKKYFRAESDKENNNQEEIQIRDSACEYWYQKGRLDGLKDAIKVLKENGTMVEGDVQKSIKWYN